MNPLYRFLKSVRVAVALILVITLFSILSTLVPQGKPGIFYRQAYGSFLADLVTGTGLDQFNRSWLFLVPMGLFIVNLGVCTVDRLVTRARTKASKRFGPDLIHLSLLILCIGSLVTAFQRQEQFFNMGQGDAVDLADGYRMTLVSFQADKYPDGRPKAWVSAVDVTRDGQPFQTGFKIEVNHPLVLGALNVYQSSFGTEGILRLTGADGKDQAVTTGQSLTVGDTEVYFAGTRQTGGGTLAQVEEWKGQNRISESDLKPGDLFGPYPIKEINQRPVTGLNAVRDPGFGPVLAALILGMTGLGLTAFQKRREEI